MLAALDQYCRTAYAGKTFADLPDADKDRIIAGMESGSLELQGRDAKPFFAALLQDTRQGFFADPIYGGNRDMAAWKMIGFPSPLRLSRLDRAVQRTLPASADQRRRALAKITAALAEAAPNEERSRWRQSCRRPTS
jgi:Gluconate 2-dehydrogenase subunit 3